jgi:hypothetical protein
MKWEYCTLSHYFEEYAHSTGGDPDQINNPEAWSNGWITFLKWSSSEEEIIWEGRRFDLKYIGTFFSARQQASILGEKGWELIQMDDSQDYRVVNPWLSTRTYRSIWHFKKRTD